MFQTPLRARELFRLIWRLSLLVGSVMATKDVKCRSVFSSPTQSSRLLLLHYYRYQISRRVWRAAQSCPERCCRVRNRHASCAVQWTPTMLAIARTHNTHTHTHTHTHSHTHTHTHTHAHTHTRTHTHTHSLYIYIYIFCLSLNIYIYIYRHSAHQLSYALLLWQNSALLPFALFPRNIYGIFSVLGLILFVDEMHMILGLGGTGDSSMDAGWYNMTLLILSYNLHSTVR